MSHKTKKDPEDSTRWVQVTPNLRDDRDRWVNGGTGGVSSMRRVGKRAAGRELDGRTWDEYPAATNCPNPPERTDR